MNTFCGSLWLMRCKKWEEKGWNPGKWIKTNRNKLETNKSTSWNKLDFHIFVVLPIFFKMGISTKPKSGVQRKSGIFYPTIMWISDKEGDMSSQPGDSTHRNWLKPLVNWWRNATYILSPKKWYATIENSDHKWEDNMAVWFMDEIAPTASHFFMFFSWFHYDLAILQKTSEVHRTQLCNYHQPEVVVSNGHFCPKIFNVQKNDPVVLS